MKNENKWKIECRVLPFSALNDPGRLKLADRSQWTEESISQFLAKAREAQRSASSKQESWETRFESFLVNFSSGGQSLFIFMDPALSLFDLHTELRKALSDLPSQAAVEEAGSTLHLDVSELKSVDQEKVIRAAGFFMETVKWKPVRFGSKARKQEAAKTESDIALNVKSSLGPKRQDGLLAQAAALGEANNLVRTLADLPSNELTPKAYKGRIERFARENGLEFEFWDRKELEKKNAGAFLAVTRADPAMGGGIACLKYRPKKKARSKIALVGKGVCFDTGGYNVKTGMHMLGMHGDMTGSALALALCGFMSETQADIEVHAFLALAENLISPTAYKPNEVVVACDGTSIEVVDTDAEGRMLLSDTLALAARVKPDLLIDYATLTGASIRALDTRRSAVFSNRPRLAELAFRAGEVSGERIWVFPSGDDYRRELKSEIADIRQCSPGDNCDHIYGATFLGHFVGADVPWVHVDLSACINKGGLGLIGTDTTGFGILWTEAFLELALPALGFKA